MEQSIWGIILMGLHWDAMLLVFLGAVTGMLVGILPGLTATMGIALLVSLTYGLSVECICRDDGVVGGLYIRGIQKRYPY